MNVRMYASFVVLSLNLQPRTFSSWSLPLVSFPRTHFLRSSLTLNRIKVAEEKRVGINRAEERRALRYGVAFYPFFPRLSRASRWEKRDGRKKNDKKAHAFFRCSCSFAVARRRSERRGGKREGSNTAVNANETHRCPFPTLLLYLSRIPFSFPLPFSSALSALSFLFLHLCFFIFEYFLLSSLSFESLFSYNGNALY